MSSVAKPTGEYADQMLEPDGWVEVDEQGCTTGRYAHQHTKTVAWRGHWRFSAPIMRRDHLS
jgi:hypothetical protein